MAGAPVNSSQPLEDADIMDIYETGVIQTDDSNDATTANTAQTSLKHDHNSLVDMSSATGAKRKALYETDEAIYGASRFGHFGEYMSRKRAKLQIQNASERKSDIFKGISVYVRLLCVLGRSERVSTKKQTNKHYGSR